MSTVSDQIRAYIQDNFLYMRPSYVLGADVGLLEAGVIDSMGVMELVVFLQDQFGIEIADDEITAEHLGTLRAMSDFVAAKRAASTSGAPRANVA